MNIKGWLKTDIWSFKDAACLLAGINPRKKHKVLFSSSASWLVGSGEGDEDSIAMHLYYIFLNTNWKKYGGLIEEERADQDAYISLILEKDLYVSSEIKIEWERFQQKAIEKEQNKTGVKKHAEKGKTQQMREAGLKTYLLVHELLTPEVLDITKMELWTKLSGFNVNLFPSSMKKNSISKFFKKQSHCKFKTGRRKGV